MFYFIAISIVSGLQVLFLQGTFYKTEQINLGSYAIEQFFVQFIFYSTLACLFQSTIIFRKDLIGSD